MLIAKNKIINLNMMCISTIYITSVIVNDNLFEQLTVEHSYFRIYLFQKILSTVMKDIVLHQCELLFFLNCFF